jgi:hypothetical protein
MEAATNETVNRENANRETANRETQNQAPETSDPSNYLQQINMKFRPKGYNQINKLMDLPQNIKFNIKDIRRITTTYGNKLLVDLIAMNIEANNIEAMNSSGDVTDVTPAYRSYSPSQKIEINDSAVLNNSST